MANVRYNKLFTEDGRFVDTWWDDFSVPATSTKIGSNSKPDFDYTNIGLLFPYGNTGEVIYLVAQMSHSKKFDTDIKLHCHYVQATEAQPTFKVAYRFYNNGAAVPETWTTISTADGNKGVFTYTSGSILQIATFPAISAPDNEGVSANLDLKFYRDDSDIEADVLVKYIDFHYEIDSFGSDDEYTN